MRFGCFILLFGFLHQTRASHPYNEETPPQTCWMASLGQPRRSSSARRSVERLGGFVIEVCRLRGHGIQMAPGEFCLQTCCCTWVHYDHVTDGVQKSVMAVGKRILAAIYLFLWNYQRNSFLYAMIYTENTEMLTMIMCILR